AVLALGLALPDSANAKRSATYPYEDMLTAESKSQTLCEAMPDRVFVRHKLGTACIAYIATKGFERDRRAVIFFDGDSPPDNYIETQGSNEHLKKIGDALQSLSKTFKVRYIRVARLGLDGSSGNHADRRKPEEVFALNAAIDALKARLGIDDVILAGQSRGSLVAASVLTMGRNDVSCAALGSGVYEHARFIYDANKPLHRDLRLKDISRTVYDPSEKIDGIAKDKRRHIYVVGDPDDAQVPFDQQRRFADQVSAAGHHARLIEVEGSGEKQHGATRYVVGIAGLCARGIEEAEIVRRTAKVSADATRVAETEREAKTAVASETSQKTKRAIVAYKTTQKELALPTPALRSTTAAGTAPRISRAINRAEATSTSPGPASRGPATGVSLPSAKAM
ncbi:MAG: alpha/beta hydrolase family protein, partial [Hyphomicrobiaceae bacterium]